MRKYKVNREIPEKALPSKETIEKYKDFSRLSHEYDRMVKRPKVPIYKDKKMFLILLLIILIAYLLSQVAQDEKESTGTEDTATEQVEN